MDQQKRIINKNKLMNRVLERHGKMGSDACEIMIQALQAVDPYVCINDQIVHKNEEFVIGDHTVSLLRFERIFLMGFGKAAVPMAKAMIDKLGQKINQANVITKDPQFLADDGYQEKLNVYLGGHPVPTEESIRSTRAILSSLPVLKESDLVMVLVSGGGSALFTDPVPGVTLEDLQSLTQSLLHCGATINEINTIRKHLDQVKGGRLAMKLQPAHVEIFILSDVVGDHLDTIASGPTVPDPSTYNDALKIIDRYGIQAKIAPGIRTYLESGSKGDRPETLKVGQLSQDKVINHLVGTNFLAAQAAYQHAESLGNHSLIVSTALTGLTDHIADFIEGILQTALQYGHPVSKPACIIFGGEPTVNVTGSGLGGRNMDLALRMVPKLANTQGVLFVSLATDGEDGPTDAAGAVADGWVFQEGVDQFGLDFESYLVNSDSYHYHEKVGGLIKTGATGTNVNDLVFVFIDRQ